MKRDQRIFKEIMEVFHDRESAIILAINAGFPKSRIPYFRTSLEFWSRVLEESANGAVDGGVQPFVNYAAELYPTNEVFTAYRTGSNTGQPIGNRLQKTIPRRIFLSHAIADRARIRGLVHLLRALGHDTFVTSDSVRPGEDREEAIKRALRFCDMILVLWTKNSSHSEEVRTEYLQALTQNSERPIIPLRLDAGVPLPQGLVRRQEIDLPVVQEILEEKAILDAENRPVADAVRMVDDVLARNRIRLPRNQRRDVLIFVCGSATTLGVVVVVSAIRRASTLASFGAKLTGVMVTSSLTFAMSIKTFTMPRTYSDSLRYAYMESKQGNKRAPTRGDTNVEGRSQGEDEAMTSSPRESLEEFNVCEGARRAIGDIKKKIDDPRHPGFPSTGAAATQKYVPAVYQHCATISQRLVPKPYVEIVCESRLDSPVEALNHSSSVLRELDRCTAASKWVHPIVDLPSLRGQTPWKRMATRRHYWNDQCEAGVEVYAHVCQLLSGTYCSGVKVVLANEFWKCLEL